FAYEVVLVVLFIQSSITVESGTPVTTRNAEFQFVVFVVWNPLPDIVRNAGCAEYRTGEAPINRIFGGNCRNSFGPHFENLVVAVHFLDVVHIFRDALQQGARAGDEVFRDVLGNSTDADIANRQ